MWMWSYKVLSVIIVCMVLPSAVTAIVSSPLTDEDEYVVIWGSFRPAGRESVHSYGIAVDVAGNVYVDDPVNNRIRTYSCGDLPAAGNMAITQSTVPGTFEAKITSTRGTEWIVGPGADDDFATIQDAIDAAADGDTIRIRGGTYREDVVVNKALILDGGYDAAVDGRIFLVADGCTLTGVMVVDGVRVESDHNTLDRVAAGWYVPGSGWGYEGFWVTGSSNLFSGCVVDGFQLGGGDGMIIESTDGNTFISTHIIDSYVGTILKDSVNTTFHEYCSFGRSDGFIAERCTDITFIDCSIRNTDYMDAGVDLLGSSATFTNCDISGGECGVRCATGILFTDCSIFGMNYGVLDGGGNTFMNCGIGGGFHGLHESDGNTCTNCGIGGGDSGVYGGGANAFTNCSIAGDYAVYLFRPHGSVFTDCRISGRGCGVYQGELSENNIFTRCTVHGDSADWCGYAFFTDAVLDDAVRAALNIPVGPVSAGDLAGLQKLHAAGRGISSLAGLEYATGLEVLDINRNSVSDLWPLIGLSGIQELILSRNEPEDLTPLVRNSDAGGLGPGDMVDLRYNGLDLTPGSAAMTAIETLAGRGVLVLYEPQEDVLLPRARFTADVTEGLAPLTVTFTDHSTGGPKEWVWDFGDGTFSTEQHPVHTYTTEGTCTVCLTVTNACGCDTMEQVNCICVHAPQPTPVDEFPVAGECIVMVAGVLGGVGMIVLGKRWG